MRIAKNKILLSMIFLLLSPVFISDAYATNHEWAGDSNLSYGSVTVNSPYWVTNGYWDVKGFQWDDPDTTYPSDFSYIWQDGVVSIWVADYEADWFPPWQPHGTTVGTLRQGSVWDATAPWYDFPPTYQSAALHFSDKSAVTLTSRVKIDSQWHEPSDYNSWSNWLFNPWFRVWSWYEGVWRERKMVWDIVWGWSSTVQIPVVHDFVDSEQNLHLAFLPGDYAQTGQWKICTFDLLEMAQQARQKGMVVGGDPWEAWLFEVDDLYLWSIDALVEGFHYDSQFSVDYLILEYTTSTGGPGGCPYVSVWNGSDYVLDNNLIPAAEHSNGTDVIDYYKLQQPLAWEDGKYSLRVWDLDKHSFLDQVRLLAVDHGSDTNIAVSPYGEVLTYKNPVPAVSAVDQDNQSVTSILNAVDGNYFEGYAGDSILLDFGDLNVSEGAKLVLRTDVLCPIPPCKVPYSIHILNATGSWIDVASIIPRIYWSTDIVDLSEYLPDGNGDVKLKLYFTAHHKIDFVGLDTTEQAEFETHYGNLVIANHNRLGDVKEIFRNSDNQHVELLPSEQVLVQFTLPQNFKEERDLIIILEGHYFIPE
jgi:hypothetical protein